MAMSNTQTPATTAVANMTNARAFRSYFATNITKAAAAITDAVATGTAPGDAPAAMYDAMMEHDPTGVAKDFVIDNFRAVVGVIEVMAANDDDIDAMVEAIAEECEEQADAAYAAARTQAA